MTRKPALVSALLMLALPAFAAEPPLATLDRVEGTVLVNQGEAFVTAQAGQALATGDRLLVMAGGEAGLTFADGCALPVAGGSLLEVPAASPCAGATVKLQRVEPLVAQADTAGEGQSGPAEKKDHTPVIIAVVAGVALVAAAGGGGDDDGPVSP